MKTKIQLLKKVPTVVTEVPEGAGGDDGDSPVGTVTGWVVSWAIVEALDDGGRVEIVTESTFVPGATQPDDAACLDAIDARVRVCLSSEDQAAAAPAEYNGPEV